MHPSPRLHPAPPARTPGPACTQTAAPVPPPPAWKDYPWPGWVPGDVRRQIEEFWSEKFGRGPSAWEADAREYPDQLALGAGTYFQRDPHTPVLSGRWVPCWNNMGRLVLPDGRVVCGSTCDLLTPERAEAARARWRDAAATQALREGETLLAAAREAGDAEAVAQIECGLVYLRQGAARLRPSGPQSP